MSSTDFPQYTYSHLQETLTYQRLPSISEYGTIRIKTAPIKTLSPDQGFKQSGLFNLIEKAITSLSMFITNEDFQFDIESPEG